MAARFVLIAMAKYRYGSVPPQFLKKPKRELLTVVRCRLLTKYLIGRFD